MRLKQFKFHAFTNAFSVSRNQEFLMSRQRATFLFWMFLLPFYAFAYGEEVLLPLFIQLGSISAFLIWITSVKFRIADKLILAAAYFLTLSMILALTWNVPYRQNKATLDLAWIVGPAAITLVTFMMLRKKKKREFK
jgi:hypothetical protein